MEIIEYNEKYLEDIKDLLVELEEYIISIDEDHLDRLHPEYRDKMAELDLEEVNEKNGKCFLAILSTGIFLSVSAAGNPYEMMLTNNKDIENRLIFFDKLYGCVPYKYHQEGVGIYLINGKINGACSLKWVMADCNFPEGVYQKFAEVQKHRTIERVNRLHDGYRQELKDKNYRYLLSTGNKYCKIIF